MSHLLFSSRSGLTKPSEKFKWPAIQWTKLSSAIISRFGVPDAQPIGLQYRDSDHDLITISSQIELDELWDEIKHGAVSKPKFGSNQQHINFILVLLDQILSPLPVDDHQSPDLFASADVNLTEHCQVTSASASNSGANHKIATPPAPTCPDELHQPVIVEAPPIHGDQFPDPIEFPIGDFASPAAASTQNLSSKVELICAVLRQADLISPQLQATLCGFAQTVAQFTGAINETCSVNANHLQEPPTRPSNSLLHSEPPPSPAVNPVYTESLLDKPHGWEYRSPSQTPTCLSPARSELFQESFGRSLTPLPSCPESPLEPAGFENCKHPFGRSLTPLPSCPGSPLEPAGFENSKHPFGR